ncbi:MAG: hypothetical protein JNK65_02765, partial [Deltaproteobacteria bacterium]|nr:hypothetical protein [Deltaproteobacteria bacterium]
LTEEDTHSAIQELKKGVYKGELSSINSLAILALEDPKAFLALEEIYEQSIDPRKTEIDFGGIPPNEIRRRTLREITSLAAENDAAWNYLLAADELGYEGVREAIEQALEISTRRTEDWKIHLGEEAHTTSEPPEIQTSSVAATAVAAPTREKKSPDFYRMCGLIQEVEKTPPEKWKVSRSYHILAAASQKLNIQERNLLFHSSFEKLQKALSDNDPFAIRKQLEIIHALSHEGDDSQKIEWWAQLLTLDSLRKDPTWPEEIRNTWSCLMGTGNCPHKKQTAVAPASTTDIKKGLLDSSSNLQSNIINQALHIQDRLIRNPEGPKAEKYYLEFVVLLDEAKPETLNHLSNNLWQDCLQNARVALAQSRRGYRDVGSINKFVVSHNLLFGRVKPRLSLGMQQKLVALVEDHQEIFNQIAFSSR